MAANLSSLSEAELAPILAEVDLHEGLNQVLAWAAGKPKNEIHPHIVAGVVTTPKQRFATVEGACFVATAAWGAAWEDRVAALRSFRDRVLQPSAFGSALVAFYRAHGPMLAGAIADRPWARALARGALTPAADLAHVLRP